MLWAPDESMNFSFFVMSTMYVAKFCICLWSEDMVPRSRTRPPRVPLRYRVPLQHFIEHFRVECPPMKNMEENEQSRGHPWEIRLSRRRSSTNHRGRGWIDRSLDLDQSRCCENGMGRPRRRVASRKTEI